MKNNKLAYALAIISFLTGVGVAIPFGGVIAMSPIAIGSICCVLSYICFSEPRKIETEKEKLAKAFLKVDTTEKNEEPVKIYEKINNMDKKPTFKGRHHIVHNEEIQNDDLGNNL